MPKRDVGRSMSLTSQESYSAVIIADMVAEVQDTEAHSNAVKRSSSTKSEVIHRKGSAKNKKEEINHAYDGIHAEASPAAVVDVDTMETVSLGKSNGTDITKGVILNAQLADHKLGSDFLNGKQIIEMKGAKEEDKAKDMEGKPSSSFKDMSVLRRIAFAASFLPSVMFVLCFAVILPCEKKVPCVEDVWTMTFDNSSVTSALKFPNSAVLTYSKGSISSFLGINASTGTTSWDETLSSTPRFVDCANLITNDSQACLVSDASGAVHFYNEQTGDQLLRWDPTDGDSAAPTPSLPTLLPDCDGDGITEVAVAVAPTRLKVLFKGFSVFAVDVSGRCSHVPERLMPWKVGDMTDLVFVCRNGSNENLVRISQEKWCMSLKKNKGKGEIVVMDMRAAGVLTNSLVQPAGDGMIVWSEEDVTMLEKNGQVRWTVTTQEHSLKNRFLMYGKFNKTSSQVALFSSDILTNLQVSTLSSETGENVWNRTIPNAETADVSLVQGSEKDFVLLVIRKIEKDLANQAAAHLGEVTTSLLNLLSKEEVEAPTVNVTATTTVIEDISLMELNGDFTYTIRDRKTSFSEGEEFRTTVTVIPEHTKEAKELSIIALKNSSDLSKNHSTQLKRINIANWDISLSQSRQCIAFK